MDDQQKPDLPASYINSYSDTRGQTKAPLPFSSVIIQGLAEQGGLFVPDRLPHINLDEIVALAGLPYAERAAQIYYRFGVDFALDETQALMGLAYSGTFSSPDVAPVVQVADHTYLLELTHGPTSAFKDLALQCLPHFFTAAQDKAAGDSKSGMPLNLILVATSGDTGSAALAGFKDREHTALIVYYPKDGVSEIQMRQMATAEGSNLGVVAVNGNFDDCQNAVKAAFNDARFASSLADQNVQLSSANSINWGRLLPQVVYYVSAYAQLVAQSAITAGDRIDVSVPTGNFGNILAAWYAREIGTPIDRLYCASNENHVLTDFLNTGSYDISDRPFTLTPSPSMDILVSSNLERQLFELNGRDPELVKQWMGDLSERKAFHVDKTTFAALRDVFSADWVTNKESLETIKEVYESHRYLLDPHTAVAWKAAMRLRPSSDTPVLIASTAHWAKFGWDVYRALNDIDPGADLPAPVSGLSYTQLLSLIQADYATAPLPMALAGLEQKPIRFTEEAEGTSTGIEQTILDWLESS
ncbi:MAG: threonine synthase [Coriobacteriia bacterium]|nr:threonine synthase [Coriobacteriia bacterium]